MRFFICVVLIVAAALAPALWIRSYRAFLEQTGRQFFELREAHPGRMFRNAANRLQFAAVGE
jgi:hypothetical protein